MIEMLGLLEGNLSC